MNEKDGHPSTIEIEKNSGNIHLVTKHDRISYKQMKQNIHNSLFETFLPSGYPNSVADGYLRFSIYSNLSALSITAMSFLST
jgi:hypothetical protein